MITCNVKHLEARCRQRGYSLAQVQGCIVWRDGDTVTVDESHPSYPHKQPRDLSVRVLQGGAGSELKGLLKLVGITAASGCSCNRHAAVMDQKGCDWCAANVDEISTWLEAEAKKRKLPYIRAAGKALIRLAIRNARKKGTCR
jgi:hypothetical protein